MTTRHFISPAYEEVKSADHVFTSFCPRTEEWKELVILLPSMAPYEGIKSVNQENKSWWVYGESLTYNSPGPAYTPVRPWDTWSGPCHTPLSKWFWGQNGSVIKSWWLKVVPKPLWKHSWPWAGFSKTHKHNNDILSPDICYLEQLKAPLCASTGHWLSVYYLVLGD